MRTILSIAAGLAALTAASLPAQAQHYGYRPYYAYPYSYYPQPYYPPPPVVYMPRSVYRPLIVARRPPAHHVTRRVRHTSMYRPGRRALINPLLGPLPGGSRGRY